jgi:hypothetical protein
MMRGRRRGRKAVLVFLGILVLMSMCVWIGKIGLKWLRRMDKGLEYVIV